MEPRILLRTVYSLCPVFWCREDTLHVGVGLKVLLVVIYLLARPEVHGLSPSNANIGHFMQLNDDALENIMNSIEGVNHFLSYQGFPHFVCSNVLVGCLRKLRLDFEAFITTSNAGTTGIESLAQRHRELWWSQQLGSKKEQLEFYGDLRQHALKLMAGSIKQYLCSLPGKSDSELEMMACGSRQLRLQCEILRSSLMHSGLNVS